MIASYDNIPILSWFILRGRCRACGTRFSIRYPLVELLTAILFVGAWLRYEPLTAAAICVFIAMMLAAAFIDLDTMEIPDRFSLGGFMLGIVLSLLIPALHGFGGDFFMADSLRSLVVALQGAFIGSGLILWIALVAELVLRKEAMGFGDVKLMGAIGAFCGWQGAVFALFGGAALGLLVIVPVLLTSRKLSTTAQPPEIMEAAEPSEEDAEAENGLRIPFGPSLVAGAIVYLLISKDYVDAYFYEIAFVLFP
jgi:leader peptidase (prepilin peptidase)/N-methyltransferase